MSSCAVKSNRLACWVLLALSVTAAQAWASDFAVIVNKENTAPVDKDTIVKIYSGELKSWKDGSAILAVDLPESNPIRASFATEVLGKTVANIKALWAQMIFSGQALPPKQVNSDEEVKKLVSANKGAVGYIKSSAVDDSVRVVLK
jgi:ABC-type phosphate transport system substrate-binding protein